MFNALDGASVAATGRAGGSHLENGKGVSMSYKFGSNHVRLASVDVLLNAYVNDTTKKTELSGFVTLNMVGWCSLNRGSKRLIGAERERERETRQRV